MLSRNINRQSDKVFVLKNPLAVYEVTYIYKTLSKCSEFVQSLSVSVF
jgi:hypothetical protein